MSYPVFTRQAATRCTRSLAKSTANSDHHRSHRIDIQMVHRQEVEKRWETFAIHLGSRD